MSTFEIAPAEDHLIVTLSGRATYATIVALLEDLDTRAAAHAGLRILVDEAELQAGWINPLDVRRIAERWGSATALRTAWIAVFAPRPVIYGLNRMFQGLAAADAESRMHVFGDRAEAEAWLRSR